MRNWNELKFGKTEGTQGRGWNTIRLGGAWMKRVKPGDRIPLFTTDGNIFGHAVVRSITCGPKEPQLFRHAEYNHLMLHENLDGNKAFERMKKLLPRLYGNLVYNRNDTITVIYLDTE